MDWLAIRRSAILSTLKQGEHRISYLESTGTQYIDTEVALGSNFKVEIDFERVNTVSKEQPFISTWTNSTQYFNFFIQTYSQNIDLYVKGHNYYGTSSIGTIYSATIIRNGTDWDITCNNVSQQFSNSTLINNPTTIKLFKRGDLNASSACYGRIYKVKVWDNNTLVLDLVPVRIGSIGYMYNEVDGKYFGNIGTGDFVIGPDI